MTRCLERLELNLSGLERVVVGERRELVLPFGACAEVGARTLAIARLKMPSKRVGVEVGEEDVADR